MLQVQNSPICGVALCEPEHCRDCDVRWRVRTPAVWQPLGIADAAQTQVPDVRFAGHESHGHLVAQLAFAQIGIKDHGKLIGRTKAARALGRAHYHRPGVLEKLLVGGVGLSAWDSVHTD